MHDPFAHLDLAGIERAEARARAAHRILFRIAELTVFVRDPRAWIPEWRPRRAIGYDPDRHRDP